MIGQSENISDGPFLPTSVATMNRMISWDHLSAYMLVEFDQPYLQRAKSKAWLIVIIRHLTCKGNFKLLNVLVNRQGFKSLPKAICSHLNCIYDSQIHSSFACMVQHALLKALLTAYLFWRSIQYYLFLANFCSRTDMLYMLDDLAGPYKVYCIVVMFWGSCAYREDVGIKDNALRIESDLLDHCYVGPLITLTYSYPSQENSHR